MPDKKNLPAIIKMGRPEIEIDWNEFDKLCQIQCTLEEIAGFFNCHERTIERACHRHWGMTFADYSKMKRQGGKIAIRNTQFQQAVNKGNTALLIWLGKQYLGQSDKISQDKTGVTAKDSRNEGIGPLHWEPLQEAQTETILDMDDVEP